MTPRMPALFLAHGNPMNALSENRFSADWQHLLGDTPRPRAVLCVSAHWETRGTWVTSAARPDTIHDFRGFPPELFAMQYPAPGDPELARRIAELPAPVHRVGLDPERGLDHGCWSVLCHLYPAANVPVLQLSLDVGLDPAGHYALAKCLAPLRDVGVLIVGSGNIVHNLQRWFRDPDGPFDWARRFDSAVLDALRAGDHAALADYLSLPDAREAVPTPEHYLPLLYVAAQQRGDDALRWSELGADSLESVSMRSLRIG